MARPPTSPSTKNPKQQPLRRARKTVRAIEHDPPVRSCLGCRCRRPQSELVRITRTTSNGNAPTLVVGGASSGRGAWLCRAAMGDQLVVDSDCLERALTQRQFDRAWRTKLDRHDVDAIRDALRHDEQHTS